MKIGDIIESAIWITGDESHESRERYKQDVAHAIDYLCHEHRFIHGPITWTEKRPGENRVPQVPDHIQGSRVRLLVGESEIIAPAPLSGKGSFIANLDKKDLERLRKITRLSAKMCGTIMNAQECDDVIERCGPEAALDVLRRTVH